MRLHSSWPVRSAVMAALVAAPLALAGSATAEPTVDAGATTFSGTVDNDAATVAAKSAIHPLDVLTTGTVTATLDWADANANLTLILKKPDGTQAAISATPNKPERVTYNATATGTYKVNVVAVAGGSSYTVAVTTGGTPPATGGAPRYVDTIGGEGHPEMAPSGLDVDPAGNVYVADTANDRITMYNAAGARQWAKGVRGTRANGNFSNPRDVAFADGRLYVGDTGYNRVQVLDAATGTWLATWTPKFGALLGVSAGVDGSGNRIVLVSDSTSQTVKTYTTGGALLKTVGKGFGAADGYFNQVRDAATDSAGNIYAADFKNQRVQVFNAAGTFLRKWGKGCTPPSPANPNPVCLPGEFKEPYGIQLDDTGNVYVSDNRRIQKFTSTGTHLEDFGSAGELSTQFFQLRRVAVGPGTSPAVYGADLWGYKILKFDQAGAITKTFGNVPPPTGRFNQPYGLSLNGDKLYVADTNNQRIQTMSASTGAFQEVWGHRGFGKDNLSGENWPRGVTFNAATNTVWVADTKNYRVIEHALNGDPTGRVFGSTGSKVDTNVLNWVYGITSYKTDVIVADTFGNRVARWSTPLGGTPTELWRATGLGSPKAVTVVGDVIYVADSVNHRIVKLNAVTGAQIGTLGESVLHRIEGIAVAPNGNIWVSDTSFNRIVELTPTGTLVQSFGKLGSDNASFNGPSQMVIGGTTGALRLYVMDTNNDRVQVFNIG